MPRVMANETFSEEEFVSSDDSDAELQELYAKGVLQPGLNVVTKEQSNDTKNFVNNVEGLKLKLESIKYQNKWTERLDLETDYAPIAPEMALQIQQHEERAELVGGGESAKNQLDEFKRESMFHRQAQAAVLEGILRLKSLGISTKRPDDYFAEMAKTDEHMQKVRSLLVKKQAETERVEKVRRLRQEKKFQKQMQAEMRLKKQNEKKQMLDEVKKFRKGVRKDLDFLEDKKNFSSNKNPNKKMGKSQLKRKYKDKKFGFGGKKRGLKRNTRESTSDFGSSKKPVNKKQTNKRPGKDVRQKMKSKKRN